MSRFVFITGSGRCGTTLMRSLLDGHSALDVYPGEITQFLESMYEASGFRFRINKDQVPLEIIQQFIYDEDDTKIKASLRLSIDSISEYDEICPQELLEKFAGVLCRSDILHWVIDVTSPNIGGYLDAFPGCLVIHMLRHPFDTINSQYRRRYFDPNSFGEAHPGIWPLPEAFDKVRRSFSEAARYRYDPRVTVVRLEDLQADPDTVIHHVCAFLGLSAEPINRIQTRRGVPFGGNSTKQSDSRVFVQARDWSCLTPNDRYVASLVPHTRDWYEVPKVRPCTNSFLRFLLRAYGLSGTDRPHLISARKFIQLLPVSIGHYMQDLAYKSRFSDYRSVI